jgi:hypothetical protein
MKQSKWFPFGAFVAWVAIAAILVIAGIAWGQASQPASRPAVTAAASFSVSMLLDWLLKLAGIVLAALIPLLLQRWLGGKVSADQLAVYSKLATDAVGHAEELGHQAVKSGTTTLDSNAKANAAVAYVMQAADALKLRPLAESAVKKLIEAKLGEGRTGGT